MAWPDPMKTVEVEWLDSRSHGGWSTVELYMQRMLDGGLACKSSGYLLDQNDERVVILQSQAESGSITDAIQIPRVAITKMTVFLRSTEEVK